MVPSSSASAQGTWSTNERAGRYIDAAVAGGTPLRGAARFAAPFASAPDGTGASGAASGGRGPDFRR